MGKYDALADWLATSGDDEISLTLVEIAEVIGAQLPMSASAYQAFWSNPTVALPLVNSGYRARPRLTEGRVEFIRLATRSPAPQQPPGAKRSGAPDSRPDLILVGCVKTKLQGTHRAKDIYQSELFRGRRRYAESAAVPWFILSAKHGLLAPDDEVESYDVSLLDLSPGERAAWGQRVLRDVDRRVGLLNGKTIEIHAAAEYRDYGVKSGLVSRGAHVVIPLERARFGEQLAWYRANAHSEGKPQRDQNVSAPTREAVANARSMSASITREFFEGTLDLSARANAPSPGWDAMPECVAVKTLVADGATPIDVRIFLTLVAAMDRARDAERLWANATRLFQRARWAYDPQEALARPLYELRDELAVSRVSQRHGPDSAGWRLILEALSSPKSPQAVRTLVFQGAGDTEELLKSVAAKRSSGQPWFPFLSGPKISVMWVRMLADPGSAEIKNLGILPVAVDVQVRKVTENLGVTQTAGRELDAVRGEIQEAWAAVAEVAVGAPALAGTGAALDPALWFFAKWGCTFCEQARRRMPIGTACGGCRYGEQDPIT